MTADIPPALGRNSTSESAKCAIIAQGRKNIREPNRQMYRSVKKTLGRGHVQYVHKRHTHAFFKKSYLKLEK